MIQWLSKYFVTREEWTNELARRKAVEQRLFGRIKDVEDLIDETKIKFSNQINNVGSQMKNVAATEAREAIADAQPTAPPESAKINQLKEELVGLELELQSANLPAAGVSAIRMRETMVSRINKQIDDIKQEIKRESQRNTPPTTY